MSNVRAIKHFLRKTFPGSYFALKAAFGRLGAEQIAVADRFLGAAPAEFRPQNRKLVRRIFDVQDWVQCEHTHGELFEVVAAIARMPASAEGVVVEAGCFKGGSAAKLSHVCALYKRRLVLFDSFEGLPPNDEPHERTHTGKRVTAFKAGAYTGALDEVRNNIRNFGRMEVCSFKRGWFDDTMPDFKTPIIAAFVDVDLVSSTRTCMKYLYPLLVPGGAIFSQDGHLKLVVDVLKDESFWRNEVGVPLPHMEGLGTRQLVGIYKR